MVTHRSPYEVHWSGALLVPNSARVCAPAYLKELPRTTAPLGAQALRPRGWPCRAPPTLVSAQVPAPPDAALRQMASVLWACLLCAGKASKAWTTAQDQAKLQEAQAGAPREARPEGKRLSRGAGDKPGPMAHSAWHPKPDGLAPSQGHL